MNANHFGSVSGSLDWKNGQGISASASYTLDNKRARQEMEVEKKKIIDEGRKRPGMEDKSDSFILNMLSAEAAAAKKDQHSLTNGFSRFFIGEIGGGFSTLLGAGADVDGYMENGKFVPRTCFVKGTLVDYANGKKTIEEIKTGDFVFAINEKTGVKSLKKVLQTYIRQTNQIYKLTYETGNKIETTWNHPFYIKGKGWTEAKDIRVGDSSILKTGESIEIISIIIEEKDVTVYNFTVEEEHNYFVGVDGVLVHNISYLWPVIGALYSIQKFFAIGGLGYDARYDHITSASTNFALNAELEPQNLKAKEGFQTNALRHVIWQAGITAEENSLVAIVAGNGHEKSFKFSITDETILTKNFSKRQDADSIVDLLNNEIGREIGRKMKGEKRLSIAINVLQEFKNSGFYVVKSHEPKGNTIERIRISEIQYQQAISNYNSINIQQSGLSNYKEGLRRTGRLDPKGNVIEN